jgi:hypothetical protein
MCSVPTLLSRVIEKVVLQDSTELIMCSDFTPTSASRSLSVTLGLPFCDPVISFQPRGSGDTQVCPVESSSVSLALFRRSMSSPATCVPPSVIVCYCRNSDKMNLGDCTAPAGNRDVKPTVEEFRECEPLPSSDSATFTCWSFSSIVTRSDA